MTEGRWLRVRRLFEAAVEQPPAERSAFVSAAIAGDETLRGDVEALLAADNAALPLSEQWPAASESLLAALRVASTAGDPAQLVPSRPDRRQSTRQVRRRGAAWRRRDGRGVPRP